jgi:hypothetical protein
MTTNNTRERNYTHMREVTKEEFFAVIGPTDVVVHIEGRWSETHGYFSEFQTRTRRVVGVCWGASKRTYKLAA